MSRYTDGWYEARVERARASARVVLPLVFDVIRPSSVVDIGCGTGSWLSVAAELGISDVLGIDAPHLDTALLEIPLEQFISHDLSATLSLDRNFDLALCLEVGEHVPFKAADALIDSVTSLAPVALFSAAVPGQGGTEHLNEQWPEYWAGLFAERGYRSHDFLRGRLWTDERVRYFYAQNAILYVRDTDAVRFPELCAANDHPPLPLVHPRLFQRSRQAFPAAEAATLRGAAHFAVRVAKRAVESGRSRIAGRQR